MAAFAALAPLRLPRACVASLAVAAYAAFRFAVEFLRADPHRGHAFAGLTISQLIAAALALAAAVNFERARRRARESNSTPL